MTNFINLYTFIVYGDCMQTTIRVDDEVLRMLELEKERQKARSYNEVILKLFERKNLSMFGADRKLGKWDESNDRAKFR